MASCHSPSANTDYYKSAQKATNNTMWINYDIEKTSYLDEKLDYTVCYNIYMRYDNVLPYFIVNDSSTMTIYRVSPKSIEMVNFQNQELTCFLNRKDDKSKYYDFYKAQLYTMAFEFMPYYFANFPSNFCINKPIINNVQTIQSDKGKQKCYTGQSPTKHIKNHITGSFDIPLQYECKTWINQKTLQIDSVIAYNISNNTFDELITYHIENINTDDKTSFFDSTFNFNSPQYRNFSRHTEFFTPYSLKDTRIDTIGDDLLNFPIINLNGDTTCIKNEHCFVLLNFWSFNCSPCLKNLQKYKIQTDSLGYRIIENEGIKIMAINYLSDNKELILKIANNTKTKDIMYYAKGMRQFIKIPYLGYYYLLSPSNDVLYESDNLGDYSKLLEAKRNYESSLKK